MMIKFLARGTGAAAADYLTREQNLSPEQKQDQDQDPEPEKNPEEVKVLRGNPHQVAEVADALEFEWGIHLTQVATRCCGRAKASTKKRIPRVLLWRGVGLRSASDSRSCRPKAATAMNSRVGRLGGHSHDARNLTFLFRSREATTHRVYLNEVDTPLER